MIRILAVITPHHLNKAVLVFERLAIRRVFTAKPTAIIYLLAYICVDAITAGFQPLFSCHLYLLRRFAAFVTPRVL
jgi:hypothetical protein